MEKEMEKDVTKKVESDIYKQVVLQIREVIMEDLSNNQGFDEKKQDEVIRILQDNFDIDDQQMGKILLENIMMFKKDTGEILNYDLPFFLAPMMLFFGYRAIIPGHTFPMFNIRNKFIGYFEKDKFYKAPSKITLFIKSDRLGFVIYLGIFIYIITFIIFYVYKGK